MLLKLLAHEAYGAVSDRASLNNAMHMMRLADDTADLQARSASDSVSALWRWYRVFLVDHIANRVRDRHY